MSGILALLRTDGAPVDPTLIQHLTRSLALRGPDQQDTWCGGRVALGHALLRTTDESRHEHQPLSLDGQVWIVADARVDARDDLIRSIGGEAESMLVRAPDAELILRAYLRWGEACVEHLLGDFAFAIWDGRRQRLFCARDHMGVKPFYYASVGRWLLVGSTLESLRRHPEVSDRLHDLAIADFLLFGFNQDSSTTSFHDIQRLAPAHTLTWSETGLGVKRYWTLPIEEPVYYRRDRDYIDRFNDLVRQAVCDRLRTERVSVFMSGGLDSPALAATARHLLRHGPSPDPVRAFTFVYDSLMADSERQYAGMVARHLDMPIRYYALDAHIGWVPSAATGTPEPVETLSDGETEMRCYADMSAHSRVAFYGEGPDNALLYEWRSHLAHLYRTRRWGRLAADVGKHLVSHKRVPLIPTIPRMLRDWRDRKQHAQAFPPWLAPDMVDRLRLDERWHELRARPSSLHPLRPRGYASLLTPMWQYLFETLDPAYTGVSLEVRHPYVDIRLLRFLLRVPAMPWCRSKYLERCALRGVVPEAVRCRPKTPLLRFPDYERFTRLGMPSTRTGRMLATFCDVRKLSYSGPATVTSVYDHLRVVALSHWVADLGERHGVAEPVVVAKTG